MIQGVGAILCMDADRKMKRGTRLKLAGRRMDESSIDRTATSNFPNQVPSHLASFTTRRHGPSSQFLCNIIIGQESSPFHQLTIDPWPTGSCSCRTECRSCCSALYAPARPAQSEVPNSHQQLTSWHRKANMVLVVRY